MSFRQSVATRNLFTLFVQSNDSNFAARKRADARHFLIIKFPWERKYPKKLLRHSARLCREACGSVLHRGTHACDIVSQHAFCAIPGASTPIPDPATSRNCTEIFQPTYKATLSIGVRLSLLLGLARCFSQLMSQE